MDPSVIKSKHDRATHEQLEVYVAFCQAHPDIATRKKSSKPPQQIQDLWKQLTEELNSCRGPTRSTAKWKETLGVWKSQLRIRARRLKMSQRLTGGKPNAKPLSDFEEKALATFTSAAVDGEKGIQSLAVLPYEHITVECPTSPSRSISSLDSPLLQPSSRRMQLPSPGSSSSSSSDAATAQLSQSERNRLIRTLMADIAKRNAAEQERRQEQLEMRQAIQSLTKSITELINVLKQNQNRLE
ncbi:uncharacterized protein LOC105665344 [Ceratitis capitata]|uniref:uncharacterized protein LOC105665344 n=1 Tax=Ceratitis capitata TaxID=7213 RepID=UPI000A1003D0|nr:uncharacterized protein LOC105665344 [Ceratitis capitata]